MAATTAGFPKLLETNIRKYFFDRFRDQAKEYTSIYTVVNMGTHYLYDHSVSPFGAATPKTEGVGITYAELTDGYNKTYEAVPYALGFRSTYEMVQDDQSGIIKKAAGMLSRSINLCHEVYAAAQFNTGFTSTTGSMDTVALFATNHPLPPGGTYSNRPTAGTELSDTSLRIALQWFDDMLDDKGFPVIVRPTRLIIPTSMRFTADEILKTPSGLYTAEGQINVLKGELTPFVWHYLTSSKAWFVAAPKEECSLVFALRTAPMFERGDDFDTGDSKWKSYTRFDVGNSGWQGLYGNPGLGSGL